MKLNNSHHDNLNRYFLQEFFETIFSEKFSGGFFNEVWIFWGDWLDFLDLCTFGNFLGDIFWKDFLEDFFGGYF